ncbi:MAG: CDP-glucose 4,6-dehydratase [Chlamydiales bacterium]|jgi:CDP-glucose 4,6-dehydratase
MKECKQNFWYDKRVLVTGATGLVGSWLCKDLVDKGADVVALVRDWDPKSELVRSGTVNKMTVVSGSLEDINVAERCINDYAVDTVIHLGAQAIVSVANRSPYSTFESNIRGTYCLLEACRKHPSLVKRVVVASSDKAYGDSESLPYTEDMPPRGKHPYDVSKSCADLITQSYYHSYDTPVVVARCGNIFGGADLNWSRIIPHTIKSLYHNESPLIRSNGQFIRDYVFIDDAVDAYLTMAQNLDNPEVRGEAFNFGPQKPLTVLDIVNSLRLLMNKEEIVPVILNEAKNEIKAQYLCSAKAKRLLSWEPKHSLEDGLQKTVEWYLEYFKTLENSPSTSQVSLALR